MRIVSLCCALLFLPLHAGGQAALSSAPSKDPSKGTGTVAGQVVRQDTGELLKKAQVTLRSNSGDRFSAFQSTDEQGHFTIENIPPGAYSLEVSRKGFVEYEYGQKKPGAPGAVLTLSSGQKMTDLVFKMIWNASISGHVYDEDGEPVPEAEVLCYRASRQLGKVQQVWQLESRTNDLGEFRIFALPPGRYYVVAKYQGSRFDLNIEAAKETESRYPAMYYPNTTDLSKAAVIAVAAGEDVRSIDFLLRPAHFVTVSGRVINTIPAPPHASGDVSLRLNVSGLAEAAQTLYDSFDMKDGHFTIHNVPPGSYTLLASWSDREVRVRHQARCPLEVGTTDVEGVVITIAPAPNVAGRVVWEGTTGVDMQDLTVRLQSVEEEALYLPQQTPKADGSFVFKSTPEGTYRPRVDSNGPEANFYLKSARYGPLTVRESGFTIQVGSELPLEITLSTRPAQVNGVVPTSDSLPAAGETVVLVPDASRRSLRAYYKTAMTDQNGKFTIKGITPGDYKLFSWDAVEGNEWNGAEWYDAEWLKPFEVKGESVHLGESDSKSVSLTLIETTAGATAAN